MLVKEITYVDYDGNKRTEEFYFNLNKSELMEMQLSQSGGMESMLKQIIASRDVPKIIELFKTIILASYGIKSPDGKRFIKSPELTEEFKQTEAYSDLFMLLATDADEASNFINGVIPQDIRSEVQKEISSGEINKHLPSGYNIDTNGNITEHGLR